MCLHELSVYEQDKCCIYCGATGDLMLDHLIPLTRGGPHAQDNLAVARRSCNSSKGIRTYSEFIGAAGEEGREDAD